MAILLVISRTYTSYRTKACTTVPNAVCLHKPWIILATLQESDRFSPCPRYICTGIKTGLWKPEQLCFQHQIFTCSEVLWSYFAFRPGNRPTSCWMSADLCICSSIVRASRLVKIAKQEEWLISYFAVEIYGFHRGGNEDGYSTQGCGDVKFGRSVSIFGRPWFLHWQFPANEDFFYNEMLTTL